MESAVRSTKGEHMLANFSLDNFRITDTRSVHEDTDYVTVSITVGTNPTVTKTQRVGDVNNGTHNVGLAWPPKFRPIRRFGRVQLRDIEQWPWQSIHRRKGSGKALSALGSKAADVASKVARLRDRRCGGSGARNGSRAPGRQCDWRVSRLAGGEHWRLPVCELRWRGGRGYARVFQRGPDPSNSSRSQDQRAADHHGTKTAEGLGGLEKLTTTTISTVASIQTIIDLNGKWAYGGVPGPVVSVTGDGVIVDMSAYHRPPAHGSIVSPSTISVNFPDDKQYIGKLVLPGTFRWPKYSSWTPVAHAAVAGTGQKPLVTTAT